MPSKYTKLSYMSFEKTLKPFCKGLVEVKNTDGTVVNKDITAQYLDSKILLESGLDADEVTRFEEGDGERSFGISKDVLSTFRNGRPLFEWIISAYAGKDRHELEESVSLHFEGELMPLLRGRRAQDAKRAIMQIIQLDKEIPSEERAYLKSSYDDDGAHVFLAKAFIFSIIRGTLTGNEIPTNAMVEQVLSDIEVSGRSTLLNGLIDSIYECAVVGVSVFDTMPYRQEDVIKFVLGIMPIFDSLNKRQQEKMIEIRMRALEYEMNGEFKAGVSKACNELFKKYMIGTRDFEISRISWSDDANTLDLQFKNKKKQPVVVCSASSIADAKTPEDFAKALGIKVEDFAKYGFDINDPIFKENK